MTDRGTTNGYPVDQVIEGNITVDDVYNNGTYGRVTISGAIADWVIFSDPSSGNLKIQRVNGAVIVEIEPSDVLRIDDGWATASVKTVTGNYTVTAADAVILVDASGGAVTVTLQNAASETKGQRWTVIKKDSSANVVTVNTAGGTINGAASQPLATQYAKLNIINDGSAYWLI